jgi:phosphoribosylformylglycinamidine cyclo-ligase
MRPEVLGGIGGFGALVEVSKKYKNPVMVAGTDGVGTKLKLAFRLKKHDTIGIDLVAMSVNDILVLGRRADLLPRLLRVRQARRGVAADVVKGIAQGCEQANCALIGGETAEMPGMYDPNEYDLAGFAVGLVEKTKIIDGASIEPGDVVLGLASSGPHSNGYSLVRKVVAVSGADLYEPFDDDRTLGEALLEPTRIYVKPVLAALAKVEVKGLAHITGAGSPRTSRACCRRRCARAWIAASGRGRRSSTGCRRRATSRTPRCTARSTAASAWRWWSRRRREGGDRALAAEGAVAYEIGAIVERKAGEPQTVCRLKSAVILISGRGSNMRSIVEARPGSKCGV